MLPDDVLPRDILPHGPALQLLRDCGREVDGWLECDVGLESARCVVESDGTVAAEVGLEMMAQAAGVALARQEDGASMMRRVGFVAAVRGYDYRLEPFVVGQAIRVRVRPEMREESLMVCEAELFVDREESPRQRARITLVVREKEVTV